MTAVAPEDTFNVKCPIQHGTMECQFSTALNTFAKQIGCSVPVSYPVNGEYI